MNAKRDLWWKDIKVGHVSMQTTAEFHSLLTAEEFALAMSLGAQAIGDAIIRILEAKGAKES